MQRTLKVLQFCRAADFESIIFMLFLSYCTSEIVFVCFVTFVDFLSFFLSFF